MTEHSHRGVGELRGEARKAPPLLLRVLGTSRHGQIVELRSGRVTIGSDETCRLRLRATGVRPFHCLLVREKSATVACSLSQDTLLNGHPFRDAVLSVGDRLQVGPIGLEVVSDVRPAIDEKVHSTAPRTPSTNQADPIGHGGIWGYTTARPFELLDRIERLEHSLEEFERRSQRIPVEASDVQPDDVASADEASGNDAPLEENNEWLLQAAEWQTIKSELQTERAEHQLTRDRLGRVDHDLRALQVYFDDIMRARHAAEEQLRGLQASVDSQLIQLRDQIESLSHGFGARHAELNEVLVLVRSELEHLAAECHDDTQSRQKFQAELTELRELYDGLSARLDRVPTPTFVPSSQGSATPKAEIPVTGASEAEASDATEAGSTHTETERTTSTASAPLQRREQLAWLAEQFAASHTDAEEPSVTVPTVSFRGANPPATDSTALKGTAPPAERPPSENNSSVDEPTGLEQVVEFATTHPLAPATSQQGSLEGDEAIPADDSCDAIARLSRAGIWKEPATASAEETDGPTSLDAVGTQRSSDPVSDAKPGSEEDSIETYMRSLLARVRGDSEQAATSGNPEAALTGTGPVMECVASADPLDTESQAMLTESDFLPRSQAPEMNSNLAAMRAIANESRTKNILTHARRTWIEKAQSKLIGAAAGISVAVGAVFFLDTDPELASVGFFGGLSMASFWLWQAFRSRRKLFATLQMPPPDTYGDSETA